MLQIVEAKQLVPGKVYKLDFGCHYTDIKDQYTYYIYNGYKKLHHAEFHEFISNTNSSGSPVLAVYEFEYDELCCHCNKHVTYMFNAEGFINHEHKLETYDIYKLNSYDDVYSYDTFIFNIYQIDK